MLRILIADDHSLVHEGLKLILQRSFGDAVFADAENAQEALAELRQAPFHLAIFDIAMPGRSGLDIIREAKQLRPQLRIIVLSMYAEEVYAERAFSAGASGYITKDKAAEECVIAIKKVMNGGLYVTASLADRLASHLGQDRQLKPHEILTNREFEVLRLIAAGQKPSAIAKILHLSTKTVNTYRERVLGKMQLKSTAELIRYAILNNLVQ